MFKRLAVTAAVAAGLTGAALAQNAPPPAAAPAELRVPPTHRHLHHRRLPAHHPLRRHAPENPPAAQAEAPKP